MRKSSYKTGGKKYRMSGGPPSISGLRLSIAGAYTDLNLCSVLHEMATHISNVDVRNALHAASAQGAPDGRLPVTVESYQEGIAESYSLTCESLQVDIPFSTYYEGPIRDVVDSAICLAIAYWSRSISDQKVQNSVEYEAMLGVQTSAQHLAQNGVLKS